MSISEKLLKVAENIPKVYKAGRDSLADESKSIAGTAKGHGSVSVNDVSEIPHEVGVKLIGKSVFTGGGLLEGGYFEDTDFGYIRSSPFMSPEEVCTLSLRLTDNNKIADDGIYCAYSIIENGSQIDAFPTLIRIDQTTFKTQAALWDGEFCIFISKANGLTLADILSASFDVGDNFTAPEPILPDFGGVKVTVSGDGNSVEHTANADGTVSGVSSITPEMTVSTDVDCDIEISYRKSFGIHTERERFWEQYQLHGARTSYGTFVNEGYFTDETFNPIYPFTVGNTQQMFCYAKSNVTDTKQPIIATGNNFNYCFNESPLKIIRGLDITKVASATALFYQAKSLKECTFLGTIYVNDISLQHSTMLNHDSLISFINALADRSEYTGETVWKVTLGPTNLAKLSEEEKNIMTQKGWQYS